MSVINIKSLCALLLILPASSTADSQQPTGSGASLSDMARERSMNVRTLTGRLLLRYVSSPRHVRWSQKLHNEAGQFFRPGAPDVQLPSTDHACLTDFAFDFDNHRWRHEIVDLTNTGLNWIGVGLPAAVNRGMDPSFFYLSSTCDGRTVRIYDRGVNRGFVKDYDPREEPDEYRLVRAFLIGTLDDGLLEAMTRLDYVTNRDGTDTIRGVPCEVYTVRPATGQSPDLTSAIGSRVARVWIAPG